MVIPFMATTLGQGASFTPDLSGGAAAPAVSGGGDVYHGDVNSGIGAFGVIMIVIFVGAVAFKVAKKK